MKKQTLSRLIAEINEDLHKEAKIAAIREGISVKDLVEKSLFNYLGKKNRSQSDAA